MRYMMPLRRLGSGLTTFHRTHWSHRRPVAVTWFAHHYSSLNSPPERPGPDRQHYSEIEFRPQSLGRTFSHNVTHSVHIQAWETIGSMADAYAILRAIERKYGRIREFRVHRDHDVPETYQTTIWAAFYSASSLPLIHPNGDVLHIAAPPLDVSKSGGIGLEDLQGLMEPQDRSESVELPSWGNVMDRVLESGQDSKPTVAGRERDGSRVIDVKIMRARQEFTFPSKLEKIEMSHYRKLAIGRAFLQWGGFYDLKPVANSPFLSSSSSPSAPERSPDVERQTPIDHVRMRTVLTRWSQLTGRRDPSIPVLTKETSPSGASGPLLDGFIEGMPETITSSVSETDARSMPTENVSVKWDPIQDPDPETLKRLQADSSDIGPQTKRRSRRARREIAKTLTATTTVDADNGSAERVVAEDNRDGQGVAQKKSDGEREVRGKQVNMDGNGFTERLQGLIGKWF